MVEVAEMGGDVEWGRAVVVFYGGEQFCGNPGDLIEEAALGGVVEWGFTVVVFYGGEEFSGDSAKVLQGAVCGGLVQSGGAGFSIDDAAGEILRGWWVARHGLAL